MNIFRILWSLAVFLLFAGISIVAAEVSRPNVILVYSDDQGSVDLGCYGTKDVLSPNLVEKHPEVVDELNAIRAKHLERLKN